LTPIAATHTVDKNDFSVKEANFVSKLNKLIKESRATKTKTKAGLPIRLFVKTNKARSKDASGKVLAGRKGINIKEIEKADLEDYVKEIKDRWLCNIHDHHCFVSPSDINTHWVIVHTFFFIWAKAIVSYLFSFELFLALLLILSI
jgi:hypothetical protein